VIYRRAGRGRLLLLAFVALSIVVVTLDFRQNEGGPLKRARDLAITVVAPVQRGFTTVTRPIGDFFSSVADLAGLRSENERLKQQVETLESEVRDMPVIARENERLREHFDLEKSWRTMDTTVAEVISSDPSNYRWSVVIGKGKADGIRQDQAVITEDGLVGKVSDTRRNNATVLLLVDPGAAASSEVNAGRDTGLVKGNGGGEYLSLQYIAKDTEVSVGDEVTTSGLDEGIFPPGIPVGTVAEVDSSDAALDQDIRIEPSVDFRSLRFVTVLLETGDQVKDENKEG
jgi:rod shape-determining protein MreC